MLPTRTHTDTSPPPPDPRDLVLCTEATDPNPPSGPPASLTPNPALGFPENPQLSPDASQPQPCHVRRQGADGRRSQAEPVASWPDHRCQGVVGLLPPGGPCHPSVQTTCSVICTLVRLGSDSGAGTRATPDRLPPPKVSVIAYHPGSHWAGDLDGSFWSQEGPGGWKRCQGRAEGALTLAEDVGGSGKPLPYSYPTLEPFPLVSFLNKEPCLASHSGASKKG